MTPRAVVADRLRPGLAAIPPDGTPRRADLRRTFVAVVLVAAVATRGDAQLREVARRVHLTGGYVRSLAAELERHGLVQVDRDRHTCRVAVAS